MISDERARRSVFFLLGTQSDNLFLLSRSLSKQKRWDLDFDTDVEKNSCISPINILNIGKYSRSIRRASSQRFNEFSNFWLLYSYNLMFYRLLVNSFSSKI